MDDVVFFKDMGPRRRPFGPFAMPLPSPRGRRARRGDVRAATLALLAERPMHGYEMIQELEARTSGMWRPSPGSVYPTLQLLEDEGLVVGNESDGKRLFTLTDAGRAAADAAGSRPAPWEQVTEGIDEATLAVRGVVGGLLGAVRQVVSAGTDEQRSRAIELLTETRRRLYGILAEEPTSAT